MRSRGSNKFQRVVLMFALAVGAGLAIAPPWKGYRPTGKGSFAEYSEPIGHYPVFAPPRPQEQIQREGWRDLVEPKQVEIWRGVRVDWLRVGGEFAALTFITLLLLLAGQTRDARGSESNTPNDLGSSSGI